MVYIVYIQYLFINMFSCVCTIYSCVYMDYILVPKISARDAFFLSFNYQGALPRLGINSYQQYNSAMHSQLVDVFQRVIHNLKMQLCVFIFRIRVTFFVFVCLLSEQMDGQLLIYFVDNICWHACPRREIHTHKQILDRYKYCTTYRKSFFCTSSLSLFAMQSAILIECYSNSSLGFSINRFNVNRLTSLKLGTYKKWFDLFYSFHRSNTTITTFLHHALQG